MPGCVRQESRAFCISFRSMLYWRVRGLRRLFSKPRIIILTF
jgi:hypothetical protein